MQRSSITEEHNAILKRFAKGNVSQLETIHPDGFYQVLESSSLRRIHVGFYCPKCQMLYEPAPKTISHCGKTVTRPDTFLGRLFLPIERLSQLRREWRA